MSTSIDATYQSVIAGLPASLQAAARGLLFGLGLARHPDAGWADVFRLEPSRDLPIFAPPAGVSWDDETLDAFRRAHHCSCFFNVLVDRLADQQAEATPERQRLAEHFLEHWRQSLARASRDGADASERVDRGVRAWRRGVGIERAALARRSLPLRRYGRIIALKLGWAGIACESLLHSRIEEHRVQLFRRAFLLLAMGMQCVDDAEDSAEDEALHGLGVPAALGYSPPALFTAGALLTRAAESSALQGGFERFAQWLSCRASELERIRQRRIRPLDNLAGMVITSSLEAVCLSMARHTRGGTADITCSASSM